MYPSDSVWIIVKINRQPVPEITEDIIRGPRVLEQIFRTLIGNWITYDLNRINICAFAEKDLFAPGSQQFQGDPKFVPQGTTMRRRLFSKLRSSIGGFTPGVLGLDCPAAYRPKPAR